MDVKKGMEKAATRRAKLATILCIVLGAGVVSCVPDGEEGRELSIKADPIDSGYWEVKVTFQTINTHYPCQVFSFDRGYFVPRTEKRFYSIRDSAIKVPLAYDKFSFCTWAMEEMTIHYSDSRTRASGIVVGKEGDPLPDTLRYSCSETGQMKGVFCREAPEPWPITFGMSSGKADPELYIQVVKGP